MKIPIAEQSVQEQVPNVQEPQVARPVEGAYGANVAEANAATGKVVSGIGETLGKHVEEQMKWATEAKAFNEVANTKEAIQAASTSVEPMEVIGADGKKTTIPTGPLMRRGHDTENAYVDAKTTYRAIYQKGLEKVPPAGRAQYARFAQSAMDGQLEKVLTHQATEGRKATTDDILSPIFSSTGLLQTSANANTPELLGETVKQIQEINAKADSYNGLNAGDTEGKNKASFKAISNAITADVSRSGVEHAQALLDSQKDKIGADSFVDLQGQLDRAARAAEVQKNAAYHKDMMSQDAHFLEANRETDPTKRPTPDDIKTAERLGMEKLPGGISKGVAAFLRRPEKATFTPEETTLIKENFSDAFKQMLDTKKMEKSSNPSSPILDTQASFEKIANFKVALAQMHQAGLKSKGEVSHYEKLTDLMWNKGLEENVNEAYAPASGMQKALHEVGRFFSGKAGSPETDPEQFKAAKFYLDSQLLDRLAKGGIKEADVPIETQKILKTFINEKYPQMTSHEGLPHAVATAHSFVPLYTGKTPYKADLNIASVKSPIAEGTTIVNDKGEKQQLVGGKWRPMNK